MDNIAKENETLKEEVKFLQHLLVAALANFKEAKQEELEDRIFEENEKYYSGEQKRSSRYSINTEILQQLVVERLERHRF